MHHHILPLFHFLLSYFSIDMKRNHVQDNYKVFNLGRVRVHGHHSGHTAAGKKAITRAGSFHLVLKVGVREGGGEKRHRDRHWEWLESFETYP